MNWALTLWAVMMGMGMAWAQDTHSIRSDRPAQMTGPWVIGQDRFQVEWGVARSVQEYATSSGRSDMSDVSLRWSPAEKWELRGAYAGARYVGELGGVDSRSFNSDVILGFRYQLVEAPQHLFSLQADGIMTLRNDQSFFGGKVWALYSFVPMEWVSLNAYLNTYITDFNLEGVVNATFQVQPQLSLYGETKYFFFSGLRFQNVGGGLAWLASPMFQFDLHITSDFLPASATQNWTLGGGVAYAIQY